MYIIKSEIFASLIVVFYVKFNSFNVSPLKILMLQFIIAEVKIMHIYDPGRYEGNTRHSLSLLCERLSCIVSRCSEAHNNSKPVTRIFRPKGFVTCTWQSPVIR
ncbi:hypothetical protein CEXT_633591 [Caerostris extrusa]|uniref:Secreted protein n=1 Tax=Caerostris extrusa TaxID=172846 RepID=A0AAV4RFQ6_CAEEX|nr:hypothetical protein CEXT_633591 [Caerostris extrusa]